MVWCLDKLSGPHVGKKVQADACKQADTRPRFPALAFYDYYTFKRLGNKVEVPRFDLPWEFQEVIGHPNEVAHNIGRHYFDSFHPFFPVGNQAVPSPS
jgi:hypothetical protein